jgi:allantoin racemase
MADILWIDPVGHAEFSDDIKSILQEASRPSTNIDVTALDRGPHHVEYHYFESLVLPDVLHTIKQAENDGYDAAVIGCFYDLGLDEAREVSESMPIIGPAEATTHLASTYGDTFSIIVGRQKWVPQMRQRVHKYGFRDRLASFRPVNLGVLDFQEDHKETRERLTRAARKAIQEDNAEAIILGCTVEYGFFEELQAELEVPVLDAVTAPFKFAELQAELTNFGWSHSKTGGYESPPDDEIHSWNIPVDYQNADVWSQ